MVEYDLFLIVGVQTSLNPYKVIFKNFLQVAELLALGYLVCSQRYAINRGALLNDSALILVTPFFYLKVVAFDDFPGSSHKLTVHIGIRHTHGTEIDDDLPIYQFENLFFDFRS